jgi:hypothetical protein
MELVESLLVLFVTANIKQINTKFKTKCTVVRWTVYLPSLINFTLTVEFLEDLVTFGEILGTVGTGIGLVLFFHTSLI